MKRIMRHALGMMIAALVKLPAVAANLRVLAVSVPVWRSVEPLLEIARELSSVKRRGDKAVSVELAIPDCLGSKVLDERWKGIEFDVEVLWLKCRCAQGSGGMNLSALQSHFEEPMTKALVDLLGARSGEAPFNVILSDRYTFAGYNIAHLYAIPLVIHNPWSLFDIDNPPAYVHSPNWPLQPSASGNPDMFDSLRNWWSRVTFVLETEKIMMESYRQVRRTLGLDQLVAFPGQCANRLVLSDSVLGWMDEPRPLPPTHQLIGAVVPPELAEIPREKRKQMPPESVVIVGAFHPSEIDLICHASSSVGMTCQFIGERCLSFEVSQICDAFQHEVSKVEHVMISSGDASCVHIAGLCQNIAGLILWPSLPEQVEIASRAVTNRYGQILAGNAITEKTIADAIRQALAMMNETRLQLDAFGNSLRLAGGRKRAVHWLMTVMELGIARFLPPECQLPWYQRHLLDVYAFYLCVLVSLAFIIRSSLFVFLPTFDEGDATDNLFQGEVAMDLQLMHSGREPGTSQSRAADVRKESKGDSRGVEDQALPKNPRGMFSYERVVR